MAIWAGVATLVVACGVWAIWLYNRLVRLRNQVRTAWADVDVQLIRRHDLVPALVAAVAGYSDHESDVLQSVTALRTRATATRTPDALGGVEHELGQALDRLVALREAYPDLKASENFAQLQRDLVTVEEQLQYARRFYNGAVRDYNDAVQRVPDRFIAGPGGFDAAPFFQAGEDERRPVRVALPT